MSDRPEFDAYCEQCLGKPKAEWLVERVTPKQTLEMLWIVIPLLTALNPKLKGLSFRPKFEPEADLLTIEFAKTPVRETLEKASFGAVRVFSERITQAGALAAYREYEGEEIMFFLPAGLSESQKLPALLLLQILRMTLPLPTDGRAAAEWRSRIRQPPATLQ
jgi:hypothetical protein